MNFKSCLAFASLPIACLALAFPTIAAEYGPEIHEKRLKWHRSFSIPDTAGPATDVQHTAVAARRQMLDQSAGLKSANSVAGINPELWEKLGPFQFGGRVVELEIDPSDPLHILLASANGGLWRSTNGALSWFPVEGIPANVSIGAIAFAPSSSQTILVGTGERTPGMGMYKSTNGGASWSRLNNTAPNDGPLGLATWSYIADIEVHPSNSDTILASLPNGGVRKSTNGGIDWTLVSPLVATGDLAVDPNAPNKIVVAPAGYWIGAGIGTLLLPRESGSRYSTDSGSTWQIASIGPTAENFQGAEYSFARSAPGVVYMMRGFGEVYRSTNSGMSFVKTNSLGCGQVEVGDCTQDQHNIAIWADPSDHQGNRLITGGVHAYYSTDGGNTFWFLDPNGASSADELHVDQHSIASSQGYSPGGVVYVANDGGVYRANVQIGPVSQNWIRSNHGLNIAQFYGVGGVGAVAAGGTQDNGVLLRSADGSWTRVWGGDGGRVDFDQTNGFLYGESQYAMVFRAPYSWSGVNVGSGSSICGSGQGLLQGKCVTDNQGAFIAPLKFSGDRNELYVLPIHPWRTSNPGTAWPVWTQLYSGNLSSQGNTAFELSKVGTAKGYFAWYNELHSFNLANPTQHQQVLVPTIGVTSIHASRWSNQELFVTSGGYESPNVFRSIDSGSSWTSVHANLPSVPISWITTHPLIPGRWYVATSVGIFATENSGSTWSAVDAGPTDAFVTELAWSDNTTLLASTYGRGMFRVSTSNPSIQIVSGNNQSAMAGGLFPLPIVVRILDGSGAPMPFATLQLTVPASGATAVGGTAVATSDSQGYATLQPGTAGTVAGGFVAQVTTPGARGRILDINLTVLGGPAFSISCFQNCSPQHQHINAEFNQPIKYKALDAHGNPATSGVVTIMAPNGGGAASISNAGTISIGMDGTASFSPFANGVTGAYSIQAVLQNNQQVSTNLTNFACSTNPFTANGAVAAGYPPSVSRYREFCGFIAPSVGSFLSKSDAFPTNRYFWSNYVRPAITSGEVEVLRVNGGAVTPSAHLLSINYVASEARFVAINAASQRFPIGSVNAVTSDKWWYYLAVSLDASTGKFTIQTKGRGSSVITNLEFTGWFSGSVAQSQTRFGWVSGSASGSVGMDEPRFSDSAVPAAYCRGDGNGNGSLTIGDATATVTEVNGGNLAAGQPDCNENGLVSVGDGTCIATLVNNSESCPL